MKEQYWSNEELSAFCLEFALLLKAGMSVGEGFLILSENEQESKKKEVFLSLYQKTMENASVYGIMREAGVFSPYMLNLVRIGEETGHLEDCFGSLSRYYDQRIRMIRLLKETVLFPTMLFIMMVAVVTILLTEVLPIFQTVFAQLGGTLPASALLFLHIGIWLKQSRYIFLAVFLVIVVLIILTCAFPSVHEKWSSFFRKRYAKTKLGRLAAEAEFAAALSMTISSGLDTNRALEIAEEFCMDTDFRGKIHNCKQKVQCGVSFVAAVEQEDLLKSMYCRMLAIGIKSGNLDEILTEIAKRTEEASASALMKTASRVEPIVVVALSLMVGFLLLSVMFPLVGIMSSLG